MKDDDKVLEAVTGLEKTIKDGREAGEKILTEQKAFFEGKYNEVKTQLDKAGTENEAKVKQLNEDLAKKGADLEEIRKQVLELKAKKGRFAGGGDEMEKKTAVIIAEAMEEHFEEIKKVGGQIKPRLELKAAGTMTASSNLTGNALATYDLTPAVRGRRKVNFRDLVPVINSTTGIWKFYRENIPVGQGSMATQSVHGSVKAQVDYALTEVTVVADYLGAFVRFAKQMAQDLPFLQNFISNELVEDYKRTESGTFLPSLFSAATGDTSAASTGVYAENIIDWIANLLANDYDPNAIITTARVWSAILRTKPSNYSIPGAIQVTAEGSIMFQGVPLLAQNNMPTGKVLVGDFTKAAIIQTDGLNVNFFEQDSDNVQRNLITARVEARVGLAILRPDAFIYAGLT